MTLARSADVGAHEARPRGWTRQVPNAHVLAGRNVLIVEDEVFVSMDIAFTLETAGARIAGATSIAAALRLLNEADRSGERFDAASLDVIIRGQTTMRVAAALRERGVPFLVHTAHALSCAALIETLDAPVLPKPALPEAVASALADLLTAGTVDP